MMASMVQSWCCRAHLGDLLRRRHCAHMHAKAARGPRCPPCIGTCRPDHPPTLRDGGHDARLTRMAMRLLGAGHSPLQLLHACQLLVKQLRATAAVILLHKDTEH